MPIYLFSNPKDENEIVEVVMSVNDIHEFFKDGIKWQRVFTRPNASIDTKWDANNPRDFIEKTGKKKGTLGEIMDKSAELSQQREKQMGIDSVKEKTYQQYSKVRGGKTHPEKRKEIAKKLTKDVMIKFNSKLKS